jgi:hypothetical protein
VTNMPTTQFQRAGYTFTPTLDQVTGEPGPIHVTDGVHSTTLQPDFLDGHDDAYITETIGAAFALFGPDAPSGPAT